MAQPGAMRIVHSNPLRSDTSRQHIHQDRVADYVLFDFQNKMYCIVGEIKNKDTTAADQNIEQMIGLFRINQRAMLGFTCNAHFVIPRVLIQDDSGPDPQLNLYTLQTLWLDNPASLLELAKLFMAFTTIVDIAL